MKECILISIINNFVRKPSGMEAFFIDLDKCGCNMTFHFYLKLDRKPSIEELDLAFNKTLETHDGINLMYIKNKWYISDYIPKCEVKKIYGDDLYSYKPNRIDFSYHTIALNVLHLVQKDEWYICFDFFHGAVDGRSGIQFVYDFFDQLNGKETTDNSFTLSDCEIVSCKKTEEKNQRKIPFTVVPNCKPSGWLPSKDGDIKVCVIKYKSNITSAAAKLSLAVGKCFNKKGAKTIVPIDIRRFVEDKTKSLFGNLFVPIFLEANKLRNVDEIHTEVIDYVKHKSWLKTIADNLLIYSKISPKIRKLIIKLYMPIVMTSRKFIYGALVSPLGAIQSERLTCKNFNVEDFAVTLAPFPFTAFSVISLQYNGYTNITISWNSGRVPKKIASKLIGNLDDCMTDKQLIYT